VIQEDNPRRNRSRCITSPAATRSTCPTTSSSPSAADTMPAAGEEAGVPLQKRAHRQSRGLEASPLGGGSSDWRARAYPPRRPRAVPSSITRTRGWGSRPAPTELWPGHTGSRPKSFHRQGRNIDTTRACRFLPETWRGPFSLGWWPCPTRRDLPGVGGSERARRLLERRARFAPQWRSPRNGPAKCGSPAFRKGRERLPSRRPHPSCLQDEQPVKNLPRIRAEKRAGRRWV
jgi:hypothetical protein